MIKFIPILFGLLATALGLTAEQRELTAWAGDAALLGVVTWGTVEMLRKYVLTKLDGLLVQVVAVVVGVFLSLGLAVSGYGNPDVMEAILRGFTAALGAFFADAGLKKAAGKSSPALSES